MPKGALFSDGDRVRFRARASLEALAFSAETGLTLEVARIHPIMAGMLLLRANGYESWIHADQVWKLKP